MFTTTFQQVENSNEAQRVQKVNTRNSLLQGVIKTLLAPTREQSQINWLKAILAVSIHSRPDLATQIQEYLQVVPGKSNILFGLTIGELSVVYEALLGLSDPEKRKQQGQFFTPDDVAAYLASQQQLFPQHGVWLDPCCGVGNLSWYLASTMKNPDDFVTNNLILMDLDNVALKTAVVLLVTSFAAPKNLTALPKLISRSKNQDFLTNPNPSYDFVIANPPYAAAAPMSGFETGDTKEVYAYFFEKIAVTSMGYIIITPASYVNGQKYAPLRKIVESSGGGEILVFDNVPDTCFRGFKYGSQNSSKTNFVRAAITIKIPEVTGWKITPILRWKAVSREKMWKDSKKYLVPLKKTVNNSWVKLMPGTENVWDLCVREKFPPLKSIVSSTPTSYVLEVASTPRYYISAVKEPLNRRSKHVLYFNTQEDLDKAYLVLNSSLPYWWWRSLDGGITLPLSVLLTLPLPTVSGGSESLTQQLMVSEKKNRVVKMNAGKPNENVCHPSWLVEQVNRFILPEIEYDFVKIYASDMFASNTK